MASTNKTSNLELSQFIATDIPTWLVDYNGDMEKIDAGVANAQNQANTTAASVNGINNKLGNANISGIGDGTITGAISAQNSNLKSLIAYKDINASEITVEGNSTANAFIPAADIAMNGYINIGVIRFDAGVGLAVTGLKQYGDGLYIGVVNRGTSSITTTPSVRMLYVKNI